MMKVPNGHENPSAVTLGFLFTVFLNKKTRTVVRVLSVKKFS